jgi:hypothetical protein
MRANECESQSTRAGSPCHPTSALSGKHTLATEGRRLCRPTGRSPAGLVRFRGALRASGGGDAAPPLGALIWHALPLPVAATKTRQRLGAPASCRLWRRGAPSHGRVARATQPNTGWKPVPLDPTGWKPVPRFNRECARIPNRMDSANLLTDVMFQRESDYCRPDVTQVSKPAMYRRLPSLLERPSESRFRNLRYVGLRDTGLRNISY